MSIIREFCVISFNGHLFLLMPYMSKCSTPCASLEDQLVISLVNSDPTYFYLSWTRMIPFLILKLLVLEYLVLYLIIFMLSIKERWLRIVIMPSLPMILW